jgi:anti-sigma B factor antagonist
MRDRWLTIFSTPSRRNEGEETMEFYYDDTDKDVLILSADGGLMYEGAPNFVSELQRYIDLGLRKLIVDCTRLRKVSSSGLGVLVSFHKRLAKQGGNVKLASVPGIVGKAIEITALGDLLHIYPTVEAARKAFCDESGAEPDDAAEVDSRHPHLK